MARYHVLQARQNYCVPACVVMIERWRGQMSDDVARRQNEIFREAELNGLCPLASVRDLVGSEPRWLDIDDPASLLVLAEFLESSWAIVGCVPGAFGPITCARGLTSPHGRLPGGPLSHHAVCVVGVRERMLSILDPWCHSTGQPFEVSFQEFAAFWTGNVLIASDDVGL